MIHITYFVHGTTYDNEMGISSGSFDVELSELGVKQAKELREQTVNKKFDAIFSSDLKRASDSARYAFEGRAPIILDKRLRECDYGTYNGKPSTIVEPLQEKSTEKRFPEGECYEDVKERVEDLLRFLKKEYDGKSIAIVSHKGPQLALDVLLRGKTWDEAFSEDWRKTYAWRAGWSYEL